MKQIVVVGLFLLGGFYLLLGGKIHSSLDQRDIDAYKNGEIVSVIEIAASHRYP